MIDAILADHRHFHSTWQIDHAITERAGGTLYGCYKQAVRELHKRWRGLRESYAARERAILDIEDLEATSPERRTDWARRDIDLAEKRLGLVEIGGVIRDTEREFLRFYGQAIACREALGIGPDEQLADNRRDELEAEFWGHQIRCMAAVDFMTSGRLGRGTVELFQCAPVDQRQALGAEILSPQAHESLIRWYLTYEPALPPPVEFMPAKAREVLSCVSRHLPLLSLNGTTADAPSSPANNSPSDCRSVNCAGGDPDLFARPAIAAAG